MLRQVAKPGLHPVTLVKDMLADTVPVAFAHARRDNSSKKATIWMTSTSVSGMFMCLPHVRLTTNANNCTQTAAKNVFQTWYSPVWIRIIAVTSRPKNQAAAPRKDIHVKVRMQQHRKLKNLRALGGASAATQWYCPPAVGYLRSQRQRRMSGPPNGVALSHLFRQAEIYGCHSEASDDRAEEKASSAAVRKVQNRYEVEVGPRADNTAVDTNEANESVECSRNGRLEAKLCYGICLYRCRLH